MSSDKESLEHFTKLDKYLDHSIEECGRCFYNYTMAQVAKEMVEKGDTEEGSFKRWSEELHKRWEVSKFYKLWVDEGEAGRDPEIEFGKRGWIP